MNDYSSTTTNIPPAAGIAFGLVWVIVIAVFYVYYAYCLYLIAKKTNTENPWLAWIPIANFWLMVKIARKNVWWFVGLIIPFVNIVVSIILWMKIAEERRRPGWWGILMIINPVNLVILALLAFTEAPNQIAPPAATPPVQPA
jgi:hypothetical protein